MAHIFRPPCSPLCLVVGTPVLTTGMHKACQTEVSRADIRFRRRHEAAHRLPLTTQPPRAICREIHAPC